ncbi:MAG: hypothetical protein MPN21_06600 [Thermoanaerobaculia bacterium]|nr:hypothetical protein [Thermoanaerobaculia bacterium]
MSGIGSWIAGLLLAVGPNGWWIDVRLAEADPTYRRLVPVAWLGETPRSLWITFHRRDEWVAAAYLPEDAEEMRWARHFERAAGQEFERLLPGLRVPRLVLREQVYREGNGLVELESLAVDSSEKFFNALLEAHVNLASRRGEAWAAEIGSRARDAMPGVPPEHREEAFRNAVLDFASHVISLAGEVARQSRRHSPQRLCGLLNPPRALFAGWQRSLRQGRFPGRWQRRSTGGTTGTGVVSEVLITREVLRADDKRWVLEEVLGARWTGDPEVDFSIFCNR